MDSGYCSRTSGALPQDLSGFGIPNRQNAFEMAGLAGDPGMGVVGRLFVVWGMALAARPLFLLVVFVSGGVRMTGRASDFAVGACFEVRSVHQGDRITGQLLRRGSRGFMAVKAEGENSLEMPGALRRRQPVAGHARLVVFGKRRQLRLQGVTDAALRGGRFEAGEGP
jgi:hypothetical protein